MTTQEQAEKLSSLTFYAVMNSEGKFFRRKGYGGYGESWTDNPTAARIYNKIGPARATISYFARDSRYPIPSLVEIKFGQIRVISDEERVKKSQKREAARQAKEQVARNEAALENARQRLEQAKRDLKKYSK